MDSPLTVIVRPRPPPSRIAVVGSWLTDATDASPFTVRWVKVPSQKCSSLGERVLCRCSHAAAHLAAHVHERSAGIHVGHHAVLGGGAVAVIVEAVADLSAVGVHIVAGVVAVVGIVDIAAGCLAALDRIAGQTKSVFVGVDVPGDFAGSFGIGVIAVGVVRHKALRGLTGRHADIGIAKRVGVRVRVPGPCIYSRVLVFLAVAVVVHAIADLLGIGVDVGVVVVAVHRGVKAIAVRVDRGVPRVCRGIGCGFAAAGEQGEAKKSQRAGFHRINPCWIQEVLHCPIAPLTRKPPWQGSFLHHFLGTLGTRQGLLPSAVRTVG